MKMIILLLVILLTSLLLFVICTLRVLLMFLCARNDLFDKVNLFDNIDEDNCLYQKQFGIMETDHYNYFDGRHKYTSKIFIKVVRHIIRNLNMIKKCLTSSGCIQNKFKCAFSKATVLYYNT